MSIYGPEGELAIMKKVLDTFPEGIVACVSDTYDIKSAVTLKWGKALKK